MFGVPGQILLASGREDLLSCSDQEHPRFFYVCVLYACMITMLLDLPLHANERPDCLDLAAHLSCVNYLRITGFVGFSKTSW